MSHVHTENPSQAVGVGDALPRPRERGTLAGTCAASRNATFKWQEREEWRNPGRRVRAWGDEDFRRVNASTRP